ncbi:MAG: uncharacterized protein A8A55_2875 [Amphiamblys sp. WSBS2006]|nr:MAG: uncharacterized protein A8A55_2875 [Amphiamblys sp. WSBS2006]
MPKNDLLFLKKVLELGAGLRGRARKTASSRCVLLKAFQVIAARLGIEERMWRNISVLEEFGRLPPESWAVFVEEPTEEVLGVILGELALDRKRNVFRHMRQTFLLRRVRRARLGRLFLWWRNTTDVLASAGRKGSGETLFETELETKLCLGFFLESERALLKGFLLKWRLGRRAAQYQRKREARKGFSGCFQRWRSKAAEIKESPCESKAVAKNSLERWRGRLQLFRRRRESLDGLCEEVFSTLLLRRSLLSWSESHRGNA